MQDSPIINIKNVTKSYKNTPVLKGINLEVKTGEFLAIVGPSGSGKSTLLHLLGGIDAASAGEIEICGKSLNKLSDKKAAKFRNETIGFVFQFFYLQQNMNIAKNLEVPLMPLRTAKNKRIARVKEVATLVGIESKLAKYPKRLSGGELQRAAIARAIINEPKIILADEPTGNLDDVNTRNILRLLLDIRNKKETTLIVVTHDERIARLADRTLRMENGGLVNA